MDDNYLEWSYRERLDERLIEYLAEKEGISLEEAMDIYYRSRLAEKIHNGDNGVQYLDHKVLAAILLDEKPEAE